MLEGRGGADGEAWEGDAGEEGERPGQGWDRAEWMAGEQVARQPRGRGGQGEGVRRRDGGERETDRKRRTRKTWDMSEAEATDGTGRREDHGAQRRDEERGGEAQVEAEVSQMRAWGAEMKRASRAGMGELERMKDRDQARWRDLNHHGESDAEIRMSG